MWQRYKYFFNYHYFGTKIYRKVQSIFFEVELAYVGSVRISNVGLAKSGDFASYAWIATVDGLRFGFGRGMCGGTTLRKMGISSEN